MHRYSSLIFTLLLLTFFPRSQNMKPISEYERLYHYAEKLYSAESATETTDSIAMATYIRVIGLLIKEKKYNETLADSYLKCGILYMSKNKQEQALGYFHNAMMIEMQSNRLSDSLLFKPYLYAGSIHYDLNNPDSAVYYYKKAEAINNKYPGLSESERLYNKFGALYYETGDYKKSISYFEKALSLIEEKKPLNVFFIVNYKSNIATAQLKLGEYDHALEIFKSLLRYHIAGDQLFHNIGTAYMEESNYEEALKSLRQIKKMDHEKFNSITKVFIRLKQYDSAQFYLTKAKNAFSDKKDNIKKVDYGITMKYSGDLKVATGRAFEAIADYQLAISSLDPSFTDLSLAGNPSSFQGFQNFTFLFDALVAKAAAFDVLNTQQPGKHYLEQSINAYTSALSLSKHAERAYFSDDAKLFLKNKVNPAVQVATDAALRLFKQTNDAHYINLAFGFAENNKASVLQAGLQNLELSAIPGLPVDLVVEEKKYKSLIAKLNIQSDQLKDSLSISALQKKIRDVEFALATAQEKLDENPVYHALRLSSSSPNIDSLQHKMINQDEAVLSYYYTTTALICFYITKDGSGFSYIPLRNTFFSFIRSLKKELETPEASSRNALQTAGSALFRELIDPVFEKIKNKKHLVIIPYNEISYVPFEMLMNPADGSLLLNKFAISYNYSANFLSDKKIEKGTAYHVLAMAPFSAKENAATVLPWLPSSADEINRIPGKKLFGPGATKMQFTFLSGQFPVIHLATHAVANDTNLLGSYIEFYGLRKDPDTLHRLYEQEIYTLDMKSVQLLILSACETGSGTLSSGEGIISLSRAFSYAGCKSVITSLWKADDLSTSFISKRLHYYLQKGLATDEALQKAKIDYLTSNEIEDRFKTPSYWAHLVLIGDHQPVVAHGFNWYILPGVLVFSGWLAFVVWKKRNRA